MTASPRLLSRRRLALLVACALLLRAVIPEGFMPVAGAGGLSVELCPGAGALPPGLATHGQGAHSGHLGHPGHRGSGDPGTGHHASCLFSAGTSTAFAAALATPMLIAPALTACGERPGTRPHVPTILRAQFSRGPPSSA